MGHPNGIYGDCYHDEVENGKDKSKAFSYYQAISHVDEFWKVVNCNKESKERNKENYPEKPVFTYTSCYSEEIHREEGRKVKRITRKSEGKEPNKIKKHEEYECTTLNSTCKAWIKRVDELKRMIKSPYRLTDSEKLEIADEGNPNNSEVPKENQTIRSPKDTEINLKS
ncbi:hypothetical protein F8M41_023990 [Gigaspora margarita]|uniref:Uncharacterized protein n=1 Tax=Gigaspora margarita TaxID=4874 RepID=A0A8H4B569_GIGMA|nr:hypothetical protein F8M41_023990 [Gigaspora margarita]